MEVGQAIFTKLRFKDGTFPEYNRFYLIVKVTGSKIGVLNASSLRGKESRLYFESNYLIEQYYPPFPKETFIKLDSYMEFDISEITDYNSMKANLMITT
ncbi:MAG: hypothetical protein IJS60_00945 [Abditibacteriota bacterium]|nr:hypothetical protein [Abditibacteriota bacterium]